MGHQRITLVDRDGHEFHYHPSTAFLRLNNLLRGHRDLLLEAAELAPGDRVLDATLGYAAEAILCAHVVGPEGRVDGIERVPELSLLVREGLQTVRTTYSELSAAMRRVNVLPAGDHLDYLRGCASGAYDVVCFDPFFERILAGSGAFSPARAFGEHAPLRPEAVEEARRVARRRVIVKGLRGQATLAALEPDLWVRSPSTPVAYAVLHPVG